MKMSSRAGWGNETPESKEKRLLAFQTIESSERLREHSIAKWIVKYIFALEVYGIGEPHPSTKYLCEKYNEDNNGHCSPTTMTQEIWWAKKSEFIATTGRGKTRTFELNVRFLTDEMAKLKGLQLKREQERARARMRVLEEFNSVELEVIPNNLPNNLPNFEAQNNRGNFTPNSNSNSKGKNNNGDFEKEFEEVWKLYPNKKGKSVALKAYTKARKSGVDRETIVKGIEAYKAEISLKQTPIKFVKHGSTWFNQQGWEDEYENGANNFRAPQNDGWADGF